MAYLQVHVVQCHNLTQPKSFFSLAPSLFVSLQFGKQTQRTPESKEAQWDYACSFPVEHNTEDSSRQLEVKLMNGRVMAAKKVVGVWKMDLEQLLGDSERRLALPVPSADTSTTLELRVLVSGVNEELPLGTTSPMTAQAPPAAEPAPGPAPAPEPRGECLAQELADLSDDGEHALPPPLLDEQSAPKHEIVSMNDAPLCSVEEVARVGAVPCRIPIKKVVQNGTPARGRPVKCISDAYALDESNSDEAGDLKFLKGSVHSLDDDDGANEWEYDGDSEMDSNAVVVEDLSGDDEWD